VSGGRFLIGAAVSAEPMPADPVRARR